MLAHKQTQYNTNTAILQLIQSNVLSQVSVNYYVHYMFALSNVSYSLSAE